MSATEFICATCGALLGGDEAAIDHAADEGHNVIPRSAVPGLAPSEDRYDLVKTLTALEVVLRLAGLYSPCMDKELRATARESIATVEAHRDALKEGLR
jgi:hypothetical protein